MDFYVDIAFAVLLRLIRNRKAVAQYLTALAKLHVTLESLEVGDPSYARTVKMKRGEP